MDTPDEHSIITPIALRAGTFLDEEMGLATLAIRYDHGPLDRLAIRDYTTLIGIGGAVNALFVTSFDHGVVDRLVEVMMEGETIEEDEREEIFNSASNEVANTIIGNALPLFPDDGRGATITPPVSIHDSGQATITKGTRVASARIETARGVVTIFILANSPV